MAKYRKSSHTIHVIKYHFVWITKYRYKILEGVIADRARTLIRQVCKRNHVEILKGHIEKDHVHLLVDAPPTLSPSKLMQYIKGVSSRKLQQEFSELNKKYWGRHLWATGYFCATSGTVTDEIIKQYIENHKDEGPEDNFSISGEPTFS